MSFEDPKGRKDENFELRMQEQYVGPIHNAVVQMEDAISDLDKYPDFKSDLFDARCHWDELPEHAMDESELSSTLEKYIAVVSQVNQAEMSDEEKIAIIRQALDY